MWDVGTYKVMLVATAKPEYEHLHRFYERAGFDGGDRRAFYARNPAEEILLPVSNDQPDAQVKRVVEGLVASVRAHGTQAAPCSRAGRQGGSLRGRP